MFKIDFGCQTFGSPVSTHKHDNTNLNMYFERHILAPSISSVSLYHLKYFDSWNGNESTLVRKVNTWELNSIYSEIYFKFCCKLYYNVGCALIIMWLHSVVTKHDTHSLKVHSTLKTGNTKPINLQKNMQNCRDKFRRNMYINILGVQAPDIEVITFIQLRLIEEM